MNTTIGLAIIGAIVAILLGTQLCWIVGQKTIPEKSEHWRHGQHGRHGQSESIVVIKEEPVYEYPVTYTSSPWRIPAYSYGSAYEYRRFHSPIVSPRRYEPSIIPRIAMSHPIRAGCSSSSIQTARRGRN